MLEQTIEGVKFKNPVGLSGGFDKNAELIRIMPAVGFGFMEVGSVTRFPYKGNRRPWSVRLPRDRSIIVNYGLKNWGVDRIAALIRNTPREIPLIANIAKTNDRTISGQGTIDDYLYSYRIVESLCDMVNINISCPNTGDGMLLCENAELLERFLVGLQDAYEHSEKKAPILVKIKPDMTFEQLSDLVNTIKKFRCVKGFIISNLSKNRELLRHSSPEEYEPYRGGISGEPIRDIATQMIRDVRRLVGPHYIIVGCGGIFTAEHAFEKLKAGANLVELVTGLIYEGPRVVKCINKGLIPLLKKEGCRHISDVSRLW